MFNSFGSSAAGMETALIGLAVLTFFIVRQFSTRSVTSRWAIAAPLVLAFFGLQGLNALDVRGWIFLGLSSSIGIGLGLVRGMTFNVWNDARGEALMRGTTLTLVLWIATIAIKFVLTFLAIGLGFGAAIASNNAETLLPAAATIGAQSMVVYLRSLDARLPATA